MKKLFLFATLCFFAFITKAQNLNFEETAKYIQKAIIGSEIVYWDGGGSGYYKQPEQVEIFKNGTIECDKGKDFKFNIFDLPNQSQAVSNSNESANVYVSIATGGYEKYLAIKMTTSEEAKRLARAFKHLWDVCIKESDPFGALDGNEKNIIKRIALVAEINKLLITQTKPYYKVLVWSKDKRLSKKENVTSFIYNHEAFKYDENTKSYSLQATEELLGWSKRNDELYSYIQEFAHPQKSIKLKGEINYHEDACTTEEITTTACKILKVSCERAGSPGSPSEFWIYVSGLGGSDVSELKQKLQSLGNLDN